MMLYIAIILLLPVSFAPVFSLYACRRAFCVPRECPAAPDAPIVGKQHFAVSPLIRRATRAIQKHNYTPVWIRADEGCRLSGKVKNLPIQNNT